MEMQARFFAQICTGERTLPSPAEMERITCLNRSAWLEQFEHNAHRIRSLVDYRRYMDDMASLIGCEPPFWKYFFLHTRIWRHLVFAATQATQFRLRGPGNKESLAQKLLMKLHVNSLPAPLIKSAIITAVVVALNAFKTILLGGQKQLISQADKKPGFFDFHQAHKANMH
ncbi:MAG: hypothetical protein EBE86_009600 [Hormoscilla sp. GUM202]|nr:hypothetical protein [Hormoscilla sp. GUM202]